MVHQTEAVACRLPTEQANCLKRAVDDLDVTTADVVQRAVEYYMQRNPDEIPAFYPEDSLAAFVEEMC